MIPETIHVKQGLYCKPNDLYGTWKDWPGPEHKPYIDKSAYDAIVIANQALAEQVELKSQRIAELENLLCNAIRLNVQLIKGHCAP